MTLRQAPSLIDVARLAGVSTATAGRALGGYGSVRDGTRERVAAAAAELGYRSNDLARSMITGSTRLIGVVVPDVTNPFFASALRGIADAAQSNGFDVLLANSDRDVVAEARAVHVMASKRVDGVVVAAADPQRGGHLVELVDRGTPVVLLDRVARGLEGVSSVMIDHEGAMHAAVEHLLGLGHRRIGILTQASRAGVVVAGPGSEPREGAGGAGAAGSTLASGDGASTGGGPGGEASAIGPAAALPSQLRLLAYLDALRDADIEAQPSWMASAPYDRDAACAAARALLERSDRPSALVCTDSVLAAGAYQAAQELGLRVPDEVSLLGFDDDAWTTLVRPQLSVVQQPSYELGVASARRLLGLVTGGGGDAPGTSLRLPAVVVPRASTGAPGPA